MSILSTRSIKTQRKAAKLSQAELARRAGISRYHLNAIECGRRGAGIKVLRAVAKALGLELTVKERK